MLESNPFAIFDSGSESQVPALSMQILKGIAEDLTKKETPDVNRASAASLCPRRRWYQRKGFKATPLAPRQIINFMLGDLTERVIVSLIRTYCFGQGRAYSEVRFGNIIGTIITQGRTFEVNEQETMSFNIGEQKITGHADGFGKRATDGKWELIEIKSAASYGYEEFKKNGPGDYINQAHALMLTEEAKALGVDSVRFIYLKKDMGNIWDRTYEFDQSIAERVINSYKRVMEDQIPDRPYKPKAETYRTKPTGRNVLPWQCGYCAFTQECWPQAKMEIKNGKPTWII